MQNETRPRPVIVQKYGGSSVADVDKIGKVADKVVAARRAGHDVVVVVSAMGKTTDGLVGLARQTAAGAGRGGDPPRRELDMLVSTGERVSMALLSIAIQARGLEAISFTGSQAGIITNDRHFDARIIEVRPHRIEDELFRGKVVIVAGYQGMSYRNEITTLGRGGSDTTAVALAAALGAEHCAIYSDVDGVYSADPRVVEDARHLPELDHAMLQEMAESGAKVLCAQAVEWARRSGIAIFARASFAPEEGARQTVVRKLAPREVLQARAVTAESNVAMGRFSDLASVDALVRAAQDAGVGIRDLSLGPGGGAFLVSLLNVPDWSAARERLLRTVPDLDLAHPVGTVSVIGDGLAVTAEPLARFLRAVRSTGAEPLGLQTSALRLGATVAIDALADVQRAVHAEFVGGATC